MLAAPLATASPRSGVKVTLEGSVLSACFDVPCRTLSWAIHNGGARVARAVAWVEVRNAELAIGVDPKALLLNRLRARGLEHAVGLLTSRSLSRYVVHRVTHAGQEAECVATVGLGNALRVGDPPTERRVAGTINVLCWTRTPLGDLALVEALSIAAEARTAAVLESGVTSRVSGSPATGTGTDCIVVASPVRPGGSEHYAGKHTEVGHVLGAAVHAAVKRGVADWIAEHEAARRPRKGVG
jgi:adenosylcobinamide amidohydrolase